MSKVKIPNFDPVIPKIDRPHSMLFQRGVQFVGNKYTDRFRWFIYHSIIIFCRLFSKLPAKGKSAQDNINTDVVFVTRDWGTFASMNKEIYNSIEEYCEEGLVSRLELLRYDSIIEKVSEYLKHNPVRHIILDTRVFINRSGYGGIFQALVNCYKFSRILKQNNVICICGMTDIIEPGQRLFAELITSEGGLIVSWGSVGNHEVPKFRHNRVIGPLFMPISWRTWEEFENTPSKTDKYDFAIIGSNYEPRKTFVEKLLPKLKQNGVNYYINIRKDLDYVDFLKIYENSKIGFNTNWIANQPNKLHFTHRNLEVMFTGCFLISQRCFGLDLYVQEGIDYISFDTEEDLIEKINYYLTHEDERLKIARSGQMKARELFGNQFVWQEIDKALNVFYYSRLPVDNARNIKVNTNQKYE